jgi:hypothetical protein
LLHVLPCGKGIVHYDAEYILMNFSCYFASDAQTILSKTFARGWLR